MSFYFSLFHLSFSQYRTQTRQPYHEEHKGICSPSPWNVFSDVSECQWPTIFCERFHFLWSLRNCHKRNKIKKVSFFRFSVQFFKLSRCTQCNIHLRWFCLECQKAFSLSSKSKHKKVCYRRMCSFFQKMLLIFLLKLWITNNGQTASLTTKWLNPVIYSHNLM